MDLHNNTNNQSQQQNQTKPTAYRVDDDDNLEEKDLKRSSLFGGSDEKKTDAKGMEGKGMGGENFGKNNLTPSADDEANPSQNAGYSNDYFKRTEPAEEHPENSNLKSEQQSGEPDYSQAQSSDKEADKDQDEAKKQPKTNTYQEGTVDNDKSEDINIPGPNELSDQQKVGE